jgi:hypothetical protein
MCIPADKYHQGWENPNFIMANALGSCGSKERIPPNKTGFCWTLDGFFLFFLILILTKKIKNVKKPCGASPGFP